MFIKTKLEYCGPIYWCCSHSSLSLRLLLIFKTTILHKRLKLIEKYCYFNRLIYLNYNLVQLIVLRCLVKLFFLMQFRKHYKICYLGDWYQNHISETTLLFSSSIHFNFIHQINYFTKFWFELSYYLLYLSNSHLLLLL